MPHRAKRMAGWIACTGTGEEPVRILAPAREIGKPGHRSHQRFAARGRCPECKRDVAVLGDPPRLVAHASYRTQSSMR